MLGAADEHWHAPSDHPHWNESFYFNFFDAKSGWGCATRIGATPNRNRQDGFICLYLPDHTTGFIATSEVFGSTPSNVAAGGIAFTCIEPFRAWRVRYDGPLRYFPEPASGHDLRRTLDTGAPTRHLQLDLEFTPMHQPFDYDRRAVRMRPLAEMVRGGARDPIRTFRRALRTLGALPAMVDAHHYEQSASVQGTVTLDGIAHPIRGFGQRDRSWGVRDMSAPTRWRWLSCQFGEALCFNATQVDILAMRVQGGFVLRDGSAEALQSWRYEATHTTSTCWPDALDLFLKTQSGDELALHTEVLTPLPVIAETDDGEALVTAARARYSWQGRDALGMVEFMEQLP